MPGIVHFTRMSRHPESLSRRSLVAGAAACAGLVTLGRRTEAAQGTATPEASPVTSPVDAVHRLGALLSMVPPDHLGGPDPKAWLFTWVDLQTHLRALGDPDLFSPQTPVASIISPVVSSDPLIMYGMDPEVRKLFGFSALEADQTLVTGMAPDQVAYYAGGLPLDDLPAAWEAAGYERRSGAQGDYWTVGEDGEMDLSSPVSRFGLGALNNVAIINDVVVFARTMELLQAVLEHAASEETSAGALQDITALVGTLPANAVNVVAVPGAGLDAEAITPENPGMPISQTLMDLLAESDDAVGPMPEIEMAFFGVTAGALSPMPGAGTPTPQVEPNAFMFADLLTGSPEDAAQTAEVVAWRLEHMVSPVAGYAYNELLTSDSSSREASSGAVATLAFTSPKGGSIWGPLLSRQDLWPFVYLP